MAGTGLSHQSPIPSFVLWSVDKNKPHGVSDWIRVEARPRQVTDQQFLSRLESHESTTTYDSTYIPYHTPMCLNLLQFSHSQTHFLSANGVKDGTVGCRV